MTASDYELQPMPALLLIGPSIHGLVESDMHGAYVEVAAAIPGSTRAPQSVPVSFRTGEQLSRGL